ncbi:MAG: hypothetical protein E5X09_15785, partial [Mesorhizobium sp.]
MSTYTGQDGLNVFARSLGSAKPIAGAELTLLAKNNEILGTATSDAEGHAVFNPGLTRGEGGMVPAVLMAKQGDNDFVFLDIEDAVAPPDKERARKNIIQALNDIDWRAKGKTVSVRINGLDTHYMYRDVVDVMEQAGDRLDTILVPKVGVPADLYMVEAMVNQIEMAKGFKTRVGLEALIETALGMANVEAIAATPGRLEAMHFGVADYAASNKARTVNIGGLNPDYPGDQWHFALSRMTVACRAYGLRGIDGPFGDFSDPEGFTAAAR